jgi:hypothetical protein
VGESFFIRHFFLSKWGIFQNSIFSVVEKGRFLGYFEYQVGICGKTEKSGAFLLTNSGQNGIIIP